MPDAVFFPQEKPLSLQELVALVGASLPEHLSGEPLFHGVASLEQAGAFELAYMDNPKYAEALWKTKAGAVLVSARFLEKVPLTVLALCVPDPYAAFAKVIAHFYPTALQPQSVFGTVGISPNAVVHPTARLEQHVTVDPTAVIGAGVEIGSGTLIGAGAVIGAQVRIGRNCVIAPQATVSHALLGNRVIVHTGVRIGQDGFGYAMGARHIKVPQIGRVIIQDDVENGANTTIDRGGTKDTIIGEGTKIDNLVQIAHNVVIGRHCVIVSLVGISGSVEIDDYVVLGGQVGIVGHVHPGKGAQIAGSSNVNSDVPAGERWGGTPAKPVRQWFREVSWLAKMAAQKDTKRNNEA